MLCEMAFIGLRNGLFRVVKWTISGHERAFFGSQKRLFRKIVTGRRNYDGALVGFSSCEMGFSVCLVFTDDMLNVMRPIVNYNKTACFLLVLRQCPYVIYFPFFRTDVYTLSRVGFLTAATARNGCEKRDVVMKNNKKYRV